MDCIKTKFFFAGFLLIIFELNSILFSCSPKIHLAKGVNYKTIKNPVITDAKSIAAGRELWKKNCSSCHGDTGLGDGVKSRTLKVFPGNFSANPYQSLSDAEIFSKIKLGLEEMPKFEGKIIDKDIWHLVNFTRTFKQ